MNTTTARPHASRLTPVLLVLLFFGPLVAATLMYTFGGDDFRPARSTAHGELLADPSTLPDTGYRASDGTDFTFRHKWTLIEVTAGDCDDACRESLYRTRQVRRALGKEMSRVQRVLVPTGALPPADFIAREHPGLILVEPGTPARATLDAALGPGSAGAIYIADPLGNVIMRFPAGTPMKDLHKDLSLLLKASRIG
jgi:hypothetical protein